MCRVRRFLAGVAFVGALAGGMLLGALPATATTFNWSYTGDDVSGSGQFVGNLLSGTTYQLIGISGAILDDDGDPFVITGLSGYAGADNKLFFPALNVVSFAGISFSTTGASWNIFTDSGAIHYGLLDSLTNPGGFADLNLRNISFTVDLTPTPLPAALVLFGTGLGLLGLLGRHKRRTTSASAAL